jgi:DNA-binding response OmpR family regulator
MAGDRDPILLIVEDDFELAELLADYFTARGYRVLTTPWGEKAIRQASDTHPDLVVLDIYLPDFDGFEVFRRLQASHRTRDIPVIFLTERGARDDRLHGLSLRAMDYITKPFDIEELELRIRNTLARAAAAGSGNPITGLPERDAALDTLDDILDAPDGWVALVAALGGLDAFRERYGFVAGDDVLRIVGLALDSAVREVCGEASFCGHLEPATLVMLVPAARVNDLVAQIGERLDGRFRYFYGTDAPPDPSEELHLALGGMALAGGVFADAGQLAAALLAAPRQIVAA